MTEQPTFTPPHPLQTAVLFLVFNRLDTTERVFAAIREAKPPRLYIAADGPRPTKAGETEKVQAVRDHVLNNIDWPCEVKTLFREKNLGCKHGVAGGITWFFENEEKGIILEDDVLPLPSFFYYCEELLERYKDNASIAMISGCNFITTHYEPASSYFFSKHNHIWGWAAWRRSWKYYDVSMVQWPAWKNLGSLRGLSDGSRLFCLYWVNIFDKVSAGKIDTWDYQWTFACWRTGGLSVLPKSNLVSNLGFDRVDATHTTGESPEAVINSVPENLEFPLQHPDSFARCSEADILIDKFVCSISLINTVKMLAIESPYLGSLVRKIKLLFSS